VKSLLFAVLVAPLTLAGTVDSARLAALANARAQEVVSARASRPIRPNAGITTSASNWILIPAAGNLQGNSGTYFRSDVMIGNYRNAAQRVEARFIPAGQSGFSGPLVVLTIPANQSISYRDMVGTVFNRTGLGSIELQTVDSGNNFDLNGRIDAFSRIWTPQPDSTRGSVSQNFGSMDLFQIVGNADAFSLGLRQDSQFRTNVGILNLDFSNAHTWTVQVLGTQGSTSFNITVPAFSLIQQSIPAGTYGDIEVVFIPPSSFGILDAWMAYATTNDNGTGDGWVSPATQTEE
jgi:hypothetical protein